MKNIFQARSVSATILALAVFTTGFWLHGCNESIKSKNIKKDNSNYSDFDFEQGANRPPTVQTLYALANVLSTQAKNEQAELVLKRIVREHPEFLPAWNSLAELQMRQRHIDEAVNTLSTALKINPKDSVILNNMGMCYMIRQDYNKALEMFTIATGVKPVNARYRANMAVCLAFLGRDDEALSLYRQILPENQAQHNLIIIQAAREKTETLVPIETMEKN